MNKVYVVVEYGGHYKEDEWETIVGVCPTMELADALKNKIECIHKDNDCNISSEEWEDMWDIYYESGRNIEDDSILNAMVELFPEYSVSDIEKAIELYDGYDDYVGVQIREVDMYTQMSEIES